jgi:hypothetical protein
MKNITLKARLITLALLAAFALALFAPARQAEARFVALYYQNGTGTQVNWNSGGQ